MLTEIKMRGAKPAAKAYKLFDAHRMFLLVNTGGSKLWRMNYVFDGKNKTLALGSYSLVGVAEARKKRDQARLDLQQGFDPGVFKKLKLKANLEASRNRFERVAREWHQVNAPSGPRSRPRTFSALSKATYSLLSAP
ncbi:Arm DNA-binding domain-containing protein [Novosphingobium sp. M1R2S20]|uniref:Arm DNA-binding domain-containing protein n=1 Tax=Novosphingobium rhizovicinum TaxID=3228928 RepID=A0ABV3REZ4_9SPHN